jgi:serine/threonine protein kinase
MLTGAVLDGGWRVVSPIARAEDETGGYFSFGYWAEAPNGRKGFLKALDYSAALDSADPARTLESLTAAYNFERAVLDQCRARRLDRVVTAISDGMYNVPNAGPLSRVQYIIFERADGNVRAQANTTKRFDFAWSLRSLHHVATGLFQLHGQGIAHQDLKPSNVLTFGEHGSKIADLGRASARQTAAPHEAAIVAGDRSYAPPELLYRHVDPDWNKRRLGGDAYLLGSMIAFFLTGTGMTANLVGKLDDSHHPNRWAGSYADVLPYLRNAFSFVQAEIRSRVPIEFRDDLCGIVVQLCEPDPLLRGHPRNRVHSSTQFSLERYISSLDLLARKAEVFLGRAVNGDRSS